MKKLKRKRKKTNYIIIGTVFIVILLMSGAYALFSQELTVLGNASISSIIIKNENICEQVVANGKIYGTWGNEEKYYNFGITIKNNNTNNTSMWHTAFSLPKNGKIRSVSNANYTIEDNIVYLSSMDYNGYLNHGDNTHVDIILSTTDTFKIGQLEVYNCFMKENVSTTLNAIISKQNSWPSNNRVAVQYNVDVSSSSNNIKWWGIELEVPNNTKVIQMWNANYILKDNILIINNASYNGIITKNNSQNFGMILELDDENTNLKIHSSEGGN